MAGTPAMAAGPQSTERPHHVYLALPTDLRETAEDELRRKIEAYPLLPHTSSQPPPGGAPIETVRKGLPVRLASRRVILLVRFLLLALVGTVMVVWTLSTTNTASVSWTTAASTDRLCDLDAKCRDAKETANQLQTRVSYLEGLLNALPQSAHDSNDRTPAEQVAKLQLLEAQLHGEMGADMGGPSFKSDFLSLESQRLERLRIKAQGILSRPEVNIMTIVNDESSFGKNRTLQDYLSMVQDLAYPKSRVSISLLVSNYHYYQRVKRELPRLAKGYKRLAVVNRDFALTIGRSEEERHDPEVQKQRRSMLGSLRNQLFYLTYDAEQFVVWIDADLVKIPSDALGELIGADRDVLTTRCERNGREYDYNAWVGTGSRASSVQRRDLHMHDLASQGKYVQLDSVGGTLLLVKADVHLRGAVFTPILVVGSRQDTQGGHDGIETEGVCYLARTLNYTCWGRTDFFVEHDSS